MKKHTVNKYSIDSVAIEFNLRTRRTDSPTSFEKIKNEEEVTEQIAKFNSHTGIIYGDNIETLVRILFNIC